MDDYQKANDVATDNYDIIPDDLLQGICYYARPEHPEMPFRLYLPGSAARGPKPSWEQVKAEWFEAATPEEVKNYREFETIMRRYLGYFWDADGEIRVRRCPPSRRLAFAIELSRASYQAANDVNTIAKFLDEVLEYNHEEGEDPITLPRCLEELKTKSEAELDRLVRYASFSDAELAMPSLNETRAAVVTPDWTVTGLLPKRVCTAYGDTDAGKTYFALEIAAAIAAGRPAFDHFPVAEGAVVFFAGEDADDVLHARVPALEAEHGPLDGKLFVRPYALPLNDDAALDKERAILLHLQSKLRAEGRRIALIVNDTLRRSLGDQDASRGDVAAKAHSVFEGIAAELGCALLVTAHQPWERGEIAGSKDFTNLVGWSLRIKGRHTQMQGRKRLVGVECRQGRKNRVGDGIATFTVDAKAVALPEGGSNLILTGYREKATAEPPVAEPAPAVANGHDREAQARDRLAAGHSASQVAKELHMRKATVLEIAKQARPG